MPKTVEEYLKEPYARILIPEEDGQYSAEILEFPGCYAVGETAEEAYRNLEETAKSWIGACLDKGLQIPSPSANQEYGGKIALRLPRSLHRQAVRMAERDKTSLNQFIVMAVAASVGAHDLYDRIAQKVTKQFTINVNVATTTSIFRQSIQEHVFDVVGFGPTNAATTFDMAMHPNN